MGFARPQRSAGHRAATLIAALFTLLCLAAPADAAVTNVAPFNGAGGEAGDPIVGDVIHDFDQVWAYATSPTGGMICIKPYSTFGGSCYGDDAYARTPVPAFFAGFVPIANGNLPSGDWMLVGTEGPGFPETSHSGPFTVRPCGGCQVPNLNKDGPFIAAAQQIAGEVNTLCGLMQTASMLYRSRAVYDFATNALTVGPGGLNLGAVVTFGVAAHAAYAEVKDGDDLTAKLPGKLGAIFDTVCKAAELIDKATGLPKTLRDEAGGWAADPPDSNFMQVTPPPVTRWDSILGLPDYGFGDERDTIDRARAYGESSLHAFERYQGAVAAADPGWAHAQAEAMGHDLIAMASTLARSADVLHGAAGQIRSEIPDSGDRTVTQSDLDTVNEVLDRVRATGYTAGEITSFHAAGLSDSAIDRIKVDMGLYDPGSVAPGELDAHLDTVADAMAAWADTAEAFGRGAAVVAGRNAVTLTPEFTHTPSPADPYDVDFEDATVNTGHDQLTVQWDFGDGSDPEYGGKAEHRYATKGTYVATETVSTRYASFQVAHPIDAGPPNKKPIASFTTSATSGLAPLTVHFDASGSSDPDGTVTSYSWDYGDGSQPDTGVTADHQFTAPNPAGYNVTLTVYDDGNDSGQASRKIIVRAAPQPPAPVDDSLYPSPIGIIDVLANDADPQGYPLTVSGHSGAAHGQVSCTALGICTYTPDDGYIGSDTFTYTARNSDALETDATVNVMVSAPPPATEPLPGEDSIELMQGGQGSVDVLANDAGDPALGFVSNTDPSHGSVNCGNDGHCVYTPDNGFAGSDGFSYTMQDSHAATATAAVTVTVLPSSSAYAPVLDAVPGTPASGSDVEWRAGVTGRRTNRPSLGVTLAGDQARIAGSTRTAPGWTATGSGADAGPAALLGSSKSVPLVKPQATVAQGTGGDGHVPIIIGNRVYTFFHHLQPTSVSCIDRTTNRLCPGYPVQVAGGTDKAPGPGVVLGSKIYMRLQTAFTYAQSVPLAIFCWDTATRLPCGMTVLERFFGTDNITSSTPILAGGKIWFAASVGRLYCFDPATSSACGSLPTGLDYGQNGIDVLAHGARVFISEIGGELACVDVSLGGPCTGWTLPKQMPGANGSGDIINHHLPDGSVDGICELSDTAELRCWPDGGGASTPVIDTHLNLGAYGDATMVTTEAETGTRTLLASFGGGVSCFDWTTLAPCTGGQYNATGDLLQDINGDLLPGAYGVAFDGGCVLAVGDPGLMFSVDPRGFAPCTGAGIDTTLDLRDQRCDGSVGGASWDSARLEDTSLGELGAARVTVRDAATGAVLATKNLVDGPLDLSGVDPAAHPAIRVSIALVPKPGNTAWDDYIPPRLRVSWHPDPRQLCFRVATKASCQPAPISAQASAGAATASKEVALAPTGCPPAPAPTTPAETPDTPPSAPPPAPARAGPPAAQLILGCAKRALVLEDVFIDRGRVQLLGVADSRFAGKKVEFIFSITGKVVAKAVVGADGHFAASAPLPPAKQRLSNDAHYLAKIGTTKSLNLKLTRRMVVTSVRAAGGKVTINGRVIPPLAPKKADRAIVLQRLVGCRKVEKVTTFLPKANGSYSVTVAASAEQKAAVYRLQTKVLPQGRAKNLISTFTLPRAVDFAG